MKRQTTKTLTKLHIPDGSPVWVDLSLVATIGNDYIDYIDYNQVNINANGQSIPHRELTRISFENGMTVVVTEHVSVLLALVEGRDPAPAQIMYKRRG